MITDEEIDRLPEDDQELAFVEFEKIMRLRVHEKEDELANEQYGNPDSYRLEYINKVLAAARVYNIEVLGNWEVPKVSGNIEDSYRQLLSDVDHFTTQIRLRHRSRIRDNSVGLDANDKAKVHHYIEKIRVIIEEADLPTDKRERLYKKLSSLSLEISKDRTGLQAGMDFYVTLCAGIGEGLEKLEPARRWLDSIARLIGAAQEKEEIKRLSSSSNRKQLEAPRKKLAAPAPAPQKDDLDDEIPF